MNLPNRNNQPGFTFFRRKKAEPVLNSLLTKSKGSAGFTLIELLIVIVIIAVIIALGAVSYATVARNSRDSQRKSDISGIAQALEQYYADYQVYPDVAGHSAVSGSANWIPGISNYLNNVPNDPLTAASSSLAKSPTSDATGKVAAFPNTLSCESENFTLSAPSPPPNGGYVVIDPGPTYKASSTDLTINPNGLVIWRPNAGLDEPNLPLTPAPGLGTATKTIYFETTGTYYFWARVRYEGPSIGNDNSFWLIVDGGTPIKVGNEDTTSDAFHWVNFKDGDTTPTVISIPINTVGTHTILLRVREDGNKIDKVIFTDDATYVPSNSGPTYGPVESCPTSAPGGGPGPGGGGPGPATPPSPSMVNCVDKKNVYCYVVAPDRQHYMLWVQLENPVDSQSVDHTNKVCNLGPAFAVERPSTNPPDLYNYCLETPKR